VKVEFVESPEEADRLSGYLGDHTRSRIVILASIAQATGRSYVDAQRLAREVRDHADVYILTPEGGRALRRNARAARNVFGGAAQVFEPPHSGISPMDTPLRVAFGPLDVDRMTNVLIADVRRLVAKLDGT